MQHTISILVVNKFGVLSRISGLFSGRALADQTGLPALLSLLPFYLTHIASIASLISVSDAFAKACLFAESACSLN